MYPNARAAYMDASVTTASPAKLLVMLCDRLALDVRRGLAAQQTGNRTEANTQLLHAQDIVLELRTSLKPELFSAGPQLASLYEYLHTRLIKANTSADTTITTECLGLATELADTWREAAMSTAAVGA